MPDDLNHAKTLFGGRLLQWADEAAVIYAMCQIGSKSIVTLKMSEVLFKNPARSGDVLEFWTRKDTPTPPTVEDDKFQNPKNIILSCDFSFVHVDENGKPAPHKLAKS